MAQLGGARGADAAAAAASVLSWVFAVWAAASHEGVHDGVCATCPRRGLFTCTGPGGCTRTSCRKLNDVARSAQAAAVLSLILVSLLVLLRIGACLGRLPPLLDPAVERAPAAHIGAAAGFLIACALAAALWDAGFCGQPAARNTPGLRLGPSPFLFIAASLLQVAAAAAAPLLRFFGTLCGSAPAEYGPLESRCDAGGSSEPRGCMSPVSSQQTLPWPAGECAPRWLAPPRPAPTLPPPPSAGASAAGLRGPCYSPPRISPPRSVRRSSAPPPPPLPPPPARPPRLEQRDAAPTPAAYPLQGCPARPPETLVTL
eukprot:TRINITY_DN11909_c0_g1_i1.p1 TRINITY_DN11909_c0_g1~~TRINITY_DN11909_c0_g1_i1.p1  ORF type:complete len:315 (+),score=52.92 TRINITY_DN11909_c0_g1_i1:64-1008(+)